MTKKAASKPKMIEKLEAPKAQEPEYNPLSNPIQITIKEVLVCALSREFDLQALEI